MKKGIIGLACGLGVVAVIVIIMLVMSMVKSESIEERYDTLLTTEAVVEEPSTTVSPYDETDTWTLPDGPKDFDLPTYEVHEREIGENERVFSIETDFEVLQIGENSLMSYDNFMADEFLQMHVSNYFFDIPKEFLPETFKYSNGLMQVETPPKEDGRRVWFVIDCLEGEMRFESEEQDVTPTEAITSSYGELSNIDPQYVIENAGKLNIETQDGHSDGINMEGISRYHWRDDVDEPITEWEVRQTTEYLIYAYSDEYMLYIPVQIVNEMNSYFISKDFTDTMFTYMVMNAGTEPEYISSETYTDRYILKIRDSFGRIHTIMHLKEDPSHIYLIN